MPPLKRLLETQLFVTGHSLCYWMVASRRESLGLGVSEPPQCSHILLMDHVVARNMHVTGNIEFELERSGMVQSLVPK